MTCFASGGKFPSRWANMVASRRFNRVAVSSFSSRSSMSASRRPTVSSATWERPSDTTVSSSVRRSSFQPESSPCSLSAQVFKGSVAAVPVSPSSAAKRTPPSMARGRSARGTEKRSCGAVLNPLIRYPPCAAGSFRSISFSFTVSSPRSSRATPPFALRSGFVSAGACANGSGRARSHAAEASPAASKPAGRKGAATGMRRRRSMCASPLVAASCLPSPVSAPCAVRVSASDAAKVKCACATVGLPLPLAGRCTPSAVRCAAKGRSVTARAPWRARSDAASRFKSGSDASTAPPESTRPLSETSSCSFSNAKSSPTARRSMPRLWTASATARFPFRSMPERFSATRPRTPCARRGFFPAASSVAAERDSSAVARTGVIFLSGRTARSRESAIPSPRTAPAGRGMESRGRARASPDTATSPSFSGPLKRAVSLARVALPVRSLSGSPFPRKGAASAAARESSRRTPESSAETARDFSVGWSTTALQEAASNPVLARLPSLKVTR